MRKRNSAARYRRNVLALMSGSVIAQALPIAVAPILTRLYTPDDFGVAALFLAVVAVMASVVNGRYELAIGIPTSDDDAINIAALGLIIALLVSTLFLTLIAVFGEALAAHAGARDIAPWMYLIPLSVLLMGVFNVLSYTNNRLGKFKDIAKANVYKSVASTATQIALGWFSKGASGLILGGLVAQLVSNIRLFSNVKSHFRLERITMRRAVAVAWRYRNFPKYSMWSGVLNSAAHNSLVFFMPMVFGLATLGVYSLATRVLSAPAALISSAIGQVFLHEATRERQLHGHARRAFARTVRQLTVIGLPIFVCAFFFSEPIFALVFGEPWRAAGVYAAALTPLIFVQFIVSTVSMMSIVFEKNHVDFYWQVILALLSLGLIWVAHHWQWSFIEYLWVTSLVLSVHYLALLAIMSSYNKNLPSARESHST